MLRVKGYLDGESQKYIETIYYAAGDALPTNVAVGSVAINPATKEIKMFDGTNWTTWKAGE